MNLDYIKFVAHGFEPIANSTKQFEISVTASEILKVIEEHQPLYGYTNSANSWLFSNKKGCLQRDNKAPTGRSKSDDIAE